MQTRRTFLAQRSDSSGDVRIPNQSGSTHRPLGHTPSRKLRATAYLTAAFLLSTATLSAPFTVRAAQTPQSVSPDAPQPLAGVNSTLDNVTPPASALPAPQPLSVTIQDGTQPSHTVSTTAATVAAVLQEQRISVSNADRVLPALTAPVTSATQIVIKRVVYRTTTETAPIPFKTVFRMSHDVTPGRIVAGHHGVPGVLTRSFESLYVNDQLLSRRLVSQKVTREPVNEETLAGIRVREARALPSRSGVYRRMRCIDMVATGYSPYEGSGSGRCATGMRAGYGVVAVDPRVIRLRSRLYIEGYGYAVAGDTGGAIKGRRVDLGHSTYSEASRVGRRHVRVWVLDGDR